jgi:hypothetical protein
MNRDQRRRSRRPRLLRPASSTDDCAFLHLCLRPSLTTERVSVVITWAWGDHAERIPPHPLDDNILADPVGCVMLNAIMDYFDATGRSPRSQAVGPTVPDEPVDG